MVTHKLAGAYLTRYEKFRFFMNITCHIYTKRIRQHEHRYLLPTPTDQSRYVVQNAKFEKDTCVYIFQT